MILDLRDLLMAMESEAKAYLQAGITRQTFYNLRGGRRAIATTTAAQLLATARALFGERVTGLRDREGRVHFHEDVITRLAALEDDNRALRLRVQRAEAREFRLRICRAA